MMPAESRIRGVLAAATYPVSEFELVRATGLVRPVVAATVARMVRQGSAARRWDGRVYRYMINPEEAGRT